MAELSRVGRTSPEAMEGRSSIHGPLNAEIHDMKSTRTIWNFAGLVRDFRAPDKFD
jgi:hypothetical protein